jgi:hypothetical protein
MLPAAATSDLYQHTSAFNGMADCATCHVAVVANLGIKWAGGVYNHKDASNVNVATCLPCHTGQRPVGSVGTPAFDHANGGTGDCVSCHTQLGVTWSGGTYNHSPAPTSCLGCHSAKMPSAATVTPSGATRDQFYHSATYVGTGECVSCHTSVAANLGVRWSGGFFGHSPKPSACSTCHEGNRPGGHHTGQDCVSCHSYNKSGWSN